MAYGIYNAYHKSILHATTNWLEKYCNETGSSGPSDTSHDLPFSDIIHVIILPNFSETLETLCETLDVLASHTMALTQYKICLAMEETEFGSKQKALVLMRLYSDSFFEIVYTIHPANLPGEIRGKSSNVAWAAKEMAHNAADGLKGRHSHEIVTIVDADTCFAEDYFTSVTYHYCTATPEQRKMLMFMPPTVFDRNLNQVPAFVRIYDIGWSIGVMSNFHDSSIIKFPCSAYSISMDLCVTVNFWDTTPEAIGEDFHMYLKCLFSTQGRVIVKTIFSPASCCNVEGIGNGISGYLDGLKAKLIQSIRHMWAALDIGYILRRILLGVLAPEYDLMVNQSSIADDKLIPNRSKFGGLTFKLFVNLIHRALEAQTLIGQAFLFMLFSLIIIPSGGSHGYIWNLLTTSSVHPYVELISKISAFTQLLILIPNVLILIYYQKYHKFVGFERWILQPMDKKESLTINSKSKFFQRSHLSKANKNFKVSRLGRRPTLFSERSLKKQFVEGLFTPIFVGVLYYLIPVFFCQIKQLFTDKLDYQVAGKPTVYNSNVSSGSDNNLELLLTKNMNDINSGNDGSINASANNLNNIVITLHQNDFNAEGNDLVEVLSDEGYGGSDTSFCSKI
ncbi:hypothetical protein HK099_006679 [Clydaea vesicula]|uniref:Glycosyltransferase 2-like domain-containing protein n=1 Tax=Clydaea vesicula TaxID=447962 RepID=A0AAD5TXR3_9FUNG|nr:hypothetical protein HK099_006679 [Clydaea vesicula]